MNRALALFVPSFALLAAAAAQQQPPQLHFDGKSWWAHVKILADDNMEGRETGSEGLRKAEAYAADQFAKAGLQPAGTNGFYQAIPFVQRRIDESKSSAALLRDGKTEPLVLGEDAFFGTRVEGSSGEITASLVFIGNGLKIPEKNYDDLEGLDLHGKIAVYLAGSPEEIPGSLAAHFGSTAERWKMLREAGVMGTIVIPNPASTDIPWSRMSLNRAHPSMDLGGLEFNETAGLQLSMTFNPSQAEKLFAGSGHTFAEIAALGKDRKRLPHFPLAVSLGARAVIQQTQLESANVVAKLVGSDPALKNEYAVLSAHIDHLGVGEPINGDRIYNGAMDDGSGSALLLDMAQNLKAHPEKLRRSILFILVTAEEKGLLGSKYFAAHPTVETKSMVADINIDMFLPILPPKVLRTQGLNESDLGDWAAAIEKSLGVKPIPDLEPQRNLFVRSDQYNFIRHGIPAIKLDYTAEPGTPEAQVFKDWLTQRYHAPSDDINQPVDLHAAAVYEEIIRRLCTQVANSDARPAWKADSFFRRYATASAN